MQKLINVAADCMPCRVRAFVIAGAADLNTMPLPKTIDERVALSIGKFLRAVETKDENRAKIYGKEVYYLGYGDVLAIILKEAQHGCN